MWYTKNVFTFDRPKPKGNCGRLKGTYICKLKGTNVCLNGTHFIMGGNWRHLRSKYGMEECYQKLG